MTRTSILDELSSYVPHTNTEMFVEGQAMQVIASVKNLITFMDKSYSPELSEDLKKRLLLAIKNDDSEKFRRQIRKIREMKTRGVEGDN